MKPLLSYMIWFSQRTRSTLLCKALETIGLAGTPREGFNCKPDLLTNFHQKNHTDLHAYLYKLGTTDNEVFAINHSYYEPHFTQLIETLRKFPACPPTATKRMAVWEHVFPSHRPIFMTRRKKVRLAVSW